MRVALFVAGLVIGVSTLASSAQERMLKIAGPWEIAGIDPAQSGYVFSRLQVAETLVSADATGKLVPTLAEKWSVSDDGLTWRFTIRSDAIFHDATPVTAEAAAASLKRAHAGVGVLSEITTEGQDVVIRLEQPFAAVPAYLVNFSTIVLAPASYGASGKVTQIIGSGPYKVKSLTPPLKLELEDSGNW